MSLLVETKRLLRRYRIYPKKRFGQHFIAESSIFRVLAELAQITPNDVVLDIGTGLGFLTHFLAEKCKEVLAVELDSRLVKILRERFKDLPNVKVIEGNVLKVHLPPFSKVVSIPPYNISSYLLKWLFNKNFVCAVLVLQKEFANRIVAPVGSKDYGWLSVLSNYHFEVEVFDELPKWMFYPPPKVDSVTVRLTPIKQSPFPVKNYNFFLKFVQALFTQRNKKVRNAIPYFLKKHYIASEEAVKFAGSLPFHDKRVRELAPEDFGELANVLSS